MKQEDKEKFIIENFARVFNKIKRVNESEMNELSPEVKQRAMDAMKDKG